eukprot:g1387.t1
MSIAYGVNSRAAVLSTVAYSLCSASMLLVNKLVQHLVQGRIPSMISSAQLLFACIVVTQLPQSVLQKVGGPPDPFEFEKVKKFLVYCLAFVLSLYCNMRALERSNIETVIVFRACTPLAVAFLESFFLRKPLPNQRSMGGLVIIALGAILYVKADKEFMIDGLSAYSWVSMYFCLICFLMVFGKSLIKDVKLTLSGNVLYTNALSLPLMFSFGIVNGEFGALGNVRVAPMGWILLLFSCIAGTGIGYSSWWCRSTVSATTFTLVGVTNKVVTVLINLLIWDKHASVVGICSLSLCLVGAYLYAPPPPRKQADVGPVKASERSVEEGEC